MIDLCAIGDLKWLTILSVDHFPSPGITTMLTSIERLIGNDATIVAILTSREQMHCQLLPTNTISNQDDPLLIDFLRRAGVDTTYVRIEETVTPATYCILQPSNELRTWLVENSVFLSNFGSHEPFECKFTYLDLYDENLEERLTILKRWSKGKVRCLVNLSTTQHELKLRQLSYMAVDTVQMSCNQSREDAMSFGRHAFQMCQTKAIVITLGEAGSVLVDQHDAYFIEAEPVKQRRMIGTGASYSAGFLLALKKGATYREAAESANKYAASFCASKDNLLQV